MVFLTNVDRILLTKKENFQTKKTHTYITHICILYIKKDQEEVQVLDDLIFFFDNFF